MPQLTAVTPPAAAGTAIARAESPGSDYADLLRRAKDAGLFDRRTGFYITRIAGNGLLLAAAGVGFVLLGDSWWQLALAAGLAVLFTQVGFIGHDAGHRQIFRSKGANYLVGLVHGNLLIGLSYGWWVDKHNRHHAHPNQEGKDPDIDIGALAFTAGQARAKHGPLTRYTARHQRYLFFPLLLLEAVQLHVSSVQALARRGRLRYRSWEALLLGAHAVGYLAAVLLVLPPLKAAVFVVVHQALFGLYLGCSFAPNHKGMPILAVGDRTDYFRRQVLTSRNVRGSRLVDVVLGGLNYQIEHHLFPSMPRPNLRMSQGLVRAFCQEHGLPYAETTLRESYGLVLRHLHRVGRTPAAAASG